MGLMYEWFGGHCSLQQSTFYRETYLRNAVSVQMQVPECGRACPAVRAILVSPLGDYYGFILSGSAGSHLR